MATYTIETLQQLQEIAPDHLADDCVLANSINAAATRDWNDGAGFVPVGSSGAPFTGTFDGNGHTISDLFIYLPKSPNIGLFGSVSAPGKFIRDVVLARADITGRALSGLLCGRLYGGSGNLIDVSGCQASGKLAAEASSVAGSQHGGLVGVSSYAAYDRCQASAVIKINGVRYEVGGFIGNAATGCTFEDCRAHGAIEATGTPAPDASEYQLPFGGFVGLASPNVTFESCRAAVSIVSSSVMPLNWPSRYNIGGFVGRDAGAAFTYCDASGLILRSGTFYNDSYFGGFAGHTQATYNQCAAFGSVEVPTHTALAANAYVGGFAGYRLGGNITNACAKGDVCKAGVGAATKYFIGGFLGSTVGATATNAYSKGEVKTAPANAGGFIGQRQSGTFTNCYFDKETSKHTVGVGGGGSQTGITGKTTEEMKTQATFSTWDFDTIWTILPVSSAGIISGNLTIWLGKVGDYENFEEGVKDNDAFSLVLPTANDIRWVDGLEALLVGTVGDEWKIASNKLDTPLTPTNFSLRQQSEYGSSRIQPVKINSSLMFVDFVARKLRELTYSIDTEKYVAPDMTALAEHITLHGITTIARQKNPDSIIWMTLGNGDLISMTYEREQDVVAWSKHPLGGDGFAQSVCVTPGATEDVVTLSVKRTIDGVEKVYIEKMASRVLTARADAHYVDCGIVFTSGAATDTITGLDHLEGETVKVLASGPVIGDGVVLDDVVVSGGEIEATLNGDTVTVTKAHVGLAQTTRLQPMRLVVEGRDGSSMGSLTRVNELTLSFMNTGAAYYAANAAVRDDTKQPIDFSDVRWENTGTIDKLFSGEVTVTAQGGFSTLNPILISSDSPLPINIRAIIPRIDRTGR